MRYRNKSDQAKWIVVSMSKRRVQPGEVVDLSIRDINHSGSNLRHFEPVVNPRAEKRQPESQPKEVEVTSPLAVDNSDYEQPPGEVAGEEGQQPEQKQEGQEEGQQPEQEQEAQEEGQQPEQEQEAQEEDKQPEQEVQEEEDSPEEPETQGEDSEPVTDQETTPDE